MIPAMEIPRSMTKLTVMRVQRKETWMKNKAKKPMELYVHIPFCVKKCDYCDFLSGPAGKERQREYFQSLGREIAAVPEFPDREITTVFYWRRNTFRSGSCSYGSNSGSDQK